MPAAVVRIHVHMSEAAAAAALMKSWLAPAAPQLTMLNHGIVFILDFYPGTNEIEVSNECFEKVKKHALFHFLSSFDYPDRISEKCHWLSRNHLSVEAYMDYIKRISAEEVMRLMMDVVQDMEELQVGGCWDETED